MRGTVAPEELIVTQVQTLAWILWEHWYQSKPWEADFITASLPCSLKFSLWV